MRLFSNVIIESISTTGKHSYSIVNSTVCYFWFVKQSSTANVAVEYVTSQRNVCKRDQQIGAEHEHEIDYESTTNLFSSGQQ